MIFLTCLLANGPLAHFGACPAFGQKTFASSAKGLKFVATITGAAFRLAAECRPSFQDPCPVPRTRAFEVLRRMKRPDTTGVDDALGPRFAGEKTCRFS